MMHVSTKRGRAGARFARWLAPRSVALLRLSMGLVFLGFGALKFVPGLSPAEALVEQTIRELTFGVVSGRPGIVLAAALESAIGLSLLTGRCLRAGLALLGPALLGILSPLVLLPDELFRGHLLAPTLAGQYVLKDIVLLAAALVITARALGAPMGERDEAGRRAVDATPAPTAWERQRKEAAA